MATVSAHVGSAIEDLLRNRCYRTCRYAFYLTCHKMILYKAVHIQLVGVTRGSINTR